MVMERKDIDPKYKWDLSVIYKDDTAFYSDYAETEKMIALNMSANMLGLGNAATPMGISAMKRLGCRMSAIAIGNWDAIRARL